MEPRRFKIWRVVPAMVFVGIVAWVVYLGSISPCDRTITYSIGTIDQQYGITNDQLITDLSQAAAIWQKPTALTLFKYDPKGDLKISLLYDSRQALSDNLSSQDSQVQSNKSAYDALVAQYDTQLQSFNTKLSAYNAQVGYWNNHGGAPTDTYNQLEAERKSLNQMADSINALGAKINKTAITVNSQVDNYNSSVNQYNTLRTQKPEDGMFFSPENKIEIYHTDNTNTLIHTLAHEMGHALGLDHNANQDSIMYEFVSDSTVATPADLSDLQTICHPVNWQVRFVNASKTIYQMLHRLTLAQ